MIFSFTDGNKTIYNYVNGETSKESKPFLIRKVLNDRVFKSKSLYGIEKEHNNSINTIFWYSSKRCYLILIKWEH